MSDCIFVENKQTKKVQSPCMPELKISFSAHAIYCSANRLTPEQRGARFPVTLQQYRIQTRRETS